jgi:hypothetical protein
MSTSTPKGSSPKIQILNDADELAKAEEGQVMKLAKFNKNTAFTWYSSAMGRSA